MADERMHAAQGVGARRATVVSRIPENEQNRIAGEYRFVTFPERDQDLAEVGARVEIELRVRNQPAVLERDLDRTIDEREQSHTAQELLCWRDQPEEKIGRTEDGKGKIAERHQIRPSGTPPAENRLERNPSHTNRAAQGAAHVEASR